MLICLILQLVLLTTQPRLQEHSSHQTPKSRVLRLHFRSTRKHFQTFTQISLAKSRDYRIMQNKDLMLCVVYQIKNINIMRTMICWMIYISRRTLPGRTELIICSSLRVKPIKMAGKVLRGGLHPCQWMLQKWICLNFSQFLTQFKYKILRLLLKWHFRKVLKKWIKDILKTMPLGLQVEMKNLGIIQIQVSAPQVGVLYPGKAASQELP